MGDNYNLGFEQDRIFVSLMSVEKLDGVGPVDNRPSTDKLHQFVKKNNKKKNLICDT